MSQKSINSSLHSPKSIPSSPKTNLRASVSSNTINNKDNKDVEIQERLSKINQEIAIIRKKRMDKGGSDDGRGRVYTAPTDYTKIPKKKFSHPKLEIIIGEIMYSPYMTNPLNQYPKETYTMSAHLKELKATGVKYVSLSPEEKPFNYIELKKKFIKEICNYNPGFGIKDKNKDEIIAMPGPYSRNSLIASFSGSTNNNNAPVLLALKNIAEHHNNYQTTTTTESSDSVIRNQKKKNPKDKMKQLPQQQQQPIRRLQPISKDRRSPSACSMDTGLKQSSTTMLLKKFQENHHQYSDDDNNTNSNINTTTTNSNINTTTNSNINTTFTNSNVNTTNVHKSNMIIDTTNMIIDTTTEEYSMEEFEIVPEAFVPNTTTIDIDTTAVATATAIIVQSPDDQYQDDFISIDHNSNNTIADVVVDDVVVVKESSTIEEDETDKYYIDDFEIDVSIATNAIASYHTDNLLIDIQPKSQDTILPNIDNTIIITTNTSNNDNNIVTTNTNNVDSTIMTNNNNANNNDIDNTSTTNNNIDSNKVDSTDIIKIDTNIIVDSSQQIEVPSSPIEVISYIDSKIVNKMNTHIDNTMIDNYIISSSTTSNNSTSKD